MAHNFGCIFVLIVNIFQSGICAPVEHGDKQSWINSNKFLGDIENHDKATFDKLVNEVAKFQTRRANSNNNDSSSLSSAIADPRGLWLNGIVPYTISATDARVKPAVMAAIADFQAKTCIKFVERKKEENYVNIIDTEQGCWSKLGNIRSGGQVLNLGIGCMTKGNALHELMHAIGFWHEQQRYDRDDYIIVLTDNIIPGKDGQDQFVKADNKNMRLIGNYDMDSVMHYPNWGFAKAPGLITIKAKNSDKTDFGGEQFTDEDVRKIRELYNCGDSSKLSTSIESGAVYYIKPEGTHNCLDVPNSSKDIVQLQQWECNGSPAQQWRITRYGTSPDTYTITNIGNNMNIDVWDKELKSDAGAVGQVEAKNPPPPHQQFILKPRNGKFHMTAVINGRILWVDVTGKLRHWVFDAGQDWSLEKVGSSPLSPQPPPPPKNCGNVDKPVSSIESGAAYYIKPEGTNNCLDVPNSSKDVVQLQQWGCNGSPAQQWKITKYGTSADTYTITNVGNNMNIDIWDKELKSDSGAVGQVEAKNPPPPHQQIVLKPQNGKFHMTAVINGRILWVDVKGKLHHFKDDAGQNWSLEKVCNV